MVVRLRRLQSRNHVSTVTTNGSRMGTQKKRGNEPHWAPSFGEVNVSSYSAQCTRFQQLTMIVAMAGSDSVCRFRWFERFEISIDAVAEAAI